MALHTQVDVSQQDREVDINPVYVQEKGLETPRYRLPENRMLPQTAAQVVRDELILDGNARLNLATFVTTWMEPEAEVLMAACADKNMIDKDEYPQTAEIERRCVNILAHLWHSPVDGNATGCSTTGSSEACMLGGMAAVALAEGPPRGRPGRVPAEPGDGHERAGVLGEILPVLGRRAADGADGAGPAAPDGGRCGGAVR